MPFLIVKISWVKWRLEGISSDCLKYYIGATLLSTRIEIT